MITVDSKDCYIYTITGGDGIIKKQRDIKKIEFEFGEDKNLNSADFTVCNTHIAFNGRFFAIGLVSENKSLFGIYSFNKATCSAQLVKWESKVSLV